jgi:hypothetical protein
MDPDLQVALPSRPSSSRAEKHPQENNTTEFAAKRRWPRVAVNMPVKVRVTTQGPTRVVASEGHGTDISVGGLAVTADIDLHVGAQVAVEFMLPNSDQPIAFRSFVRNRDGNRYGLEFITENDDDYRKVGELQSEIANMHSSPSALPD